MSLELFSELKSQIPKETLDEILLELQAKYQKAYVSESGGYGFVRHGENYQIKEPPLFDLFILNDKVILSVYGDLNDQNTIKDQVSNIFVKKNIPVDFVEE